MEKKNIITYRNIDGDSWQAMSSDDMPNVIRKGYATAIRATSYGRHSGYQYDEPQTIEIPLHSIYEIKLG